MDPDQSREILQTALRAAGEEQLKYFGKKGTSRKKESISSIVTDADYASERVVFEILKSLPDPCNIISEESGFLDKGSAYTWIVDPLDGTSNFAAGLPWFGVIIALFKDHKPIQGGMYLPLENQLLYAEYGKGAFINDTAISSTDRGALEEQLIAYSFDYCDDPAKASWEMELLQQLSARVRNIRSTNSLVDFCFVANGKLGAAINQSTKIWDIAAASLLIEEAGGRVSDITGKNIDYKLSALSFDQNYTIIASGSGLHQEIIDIINPNP